MISSSPITKIQPKIRFNKFNSNWETVTLKDLTNIVGRIGFRGYTVADIVPKGKGAITISPSNIFDSKVDFNECTYISWDKYEESPEIKIYDGDIIFVKTGSTIGKTAFVKGLKEKATLNPQLVVLKNISIDNTFLFYRMLSKDFRKNVVKIAVGGAIPTLSQVELGKISFRIPSEKEQQQIASFLSSIDDWIENLTQQKLALEKYKKGMMQKLFSQELRFKNDKGSNFPAWEEKMLGDICEYKNGGSFENNIVENGIYNLITLNSIDIDGRLKSEHKKVSKADWYLEKGDLIMVLSDVAHGNFLGLVDVIPENNKFVLNQRMGLLRKKNNNVDLNFLRTYINFNQRYFKRYGQGSSQLNLSKGDVLKFKVKIPQLDEQKKISDILVTIEQMIAIKNSELLSTEEWKKGLMQKLFI